MHANFTPEENIHIFDARGIARRFRHSAVFGALGALRSGETMRFVNDDRLSRAWPRRGSGGRRHRRASGRMTEHFRGFFEQAPRITVRDPLAAVLGASDDGLLVYGYADAVRLAGHSCPTVAGAS